MPTTPSRPARSLAAIPALAFIVLSVAAGLPDRAEAQAQAKPAPAAKPAPRPAPDARKALHGAFLQNLSLKSYRATMTDLRANRQVAVVEFQAPDRYRMTMAGQPPTVIVGDTMYMRHDGKVMTVPLPKGTLGQFRNESAIRDLEKGNAVRTLGPAMVGAEPAMKYGFDTVQPGGGHSSVAWISLRSNRLLVIETTGKSNGVEHTMRVAYGDFDSPAIRIAPPK